MFKIGDKVRELNDGHCSQHGYVVAVHDEMVEATKEQVVTMRIVGTRARMVQRLASDLALDEPVSGT